MLLVNNNSNNKDATNVWICALYISTSKSNMDDDKTREAGIDANIPSKKKYEIPLPQGFTHTKLEVDVT